MDFPGVVGVIVEQQDLRALGKVNDGLCGFVKSDFFGDRFGSGGGEFPKRSAVANVYIGVLT